MIVAVLAMIVLDLVSMESVMLTVTLRPVVEAAPTQTILVKVTVADPLVSAAKLKPIVRMTVLVANVPIIRLLDFSILLY